MNESLGCDIEMSRSWTKVLTVTQKYFSWFETVMLVWYIMSWIFSTLAFHDILSIRPQETYFNEILFEIQKFSFTKMHLKISSAKSRPFCHGLDVLKWRAMSHEMLLQVCYEFMRIQVFHLPISFRIVLLTLGQSQSGIVSESVKSSWGIWVNRKEQNVARSLCIFIGIEYNYLCTLKRPLSKT